MAERVQFVLNDQGRVALAAKLGPSVDKVEGIVEQTGDQTYGISVIRVTQIDGSKSLWTGERVDVRQEYVAGYSTRRLSRSRTALLVGGITVGIVTFIVGKSLLLGGGGVEPSDPGPPGPASLKGTPQS